MEPVALLETTSLASDSIAFTSPDQATVNPGSALASLWIMTSQDQNPPASVPSTVPEIATCPKCGMHFNASLYSPIHQACLNCGWADLADS